MIKGKTDFLERNNSQVHELTRIPFTKIPREHNVPCYRHWDMKWEHNEENGHEARRLL